MSEVLWRGQDQQDQWVMNLLTKSSGFFVDIGAFDGEVLSNTVVLERFFNWRGLLVEADLDSATRCSLKRLSKTVCAVLGDNEEQVPFWVNPNDPMLNTLDPVIARRFPEAVKSMRKKQHAGKFLKINEIPLEFDYLSIDVEGEDWPVLSSILMFGYLPTLISIEVDKWTAGEKKERKHLLKVLYQYQVAEERNHDWLIAREDMV